MSSLFFNFADSSPGITRGDLSGKYRCPALAGMVRVTKDLAAGCAPAEASSQKAKEGATGCLAPA